MKKLPSWNEAVAKRRNRLGAVSAGVNELGVRNSPPDIGRREARARQGEALINDATSRGSREASFSGADGVVGNETSFKECIPKHFVNPNHPVCAAAVASHLFLAQPPLLYQEGNC